MIIKSKIKVIIGVYQRRRKRRNERMNFIYLYYLFNRIMLESEEVIKNIGHYILDRTIG